MGGGGNAGGAASVWMTNVTVTGGGGGATRGVLLDGAGASAYIDGVPRPECKDVQCQDVQCRGPPCRPLLPCCTAVPPCSVEAASVEWGLAGGGSLD